MDQYPVLHTLLGNNVKWSTAIKEADPDYFPYSAGNPQRPKARYLLVASSFHTALISLRFDVLGALDWLLGFQST